MIGRLRLSAEWPQNSGSVKAPDLYGRPAVHVVALLWCAGLAAMLALTGGDAWRLALIWAPAGAILVSLRDRRRAAQ